MPSETDHELESEAYPAAQRVQRSYKGIFALAALVIILAERVLTFSEFHPAISGLAQLSEGLLCGAAITAVFTGIISLMLLFEFDGATETAETGPLVAISWISILLVDMSCVELLVGMVCWYCSKSSPWAGKVMSIYLVGLLCTCIALSVWMWAQRPMMNRVRL